MIVRAASRADMPVMLEIAREFVAEIGWGWTYDPVASERTLESYLAYPGSEILLAEGAQVRGACIVTSGRQFSRERIAEIDKLFVRRAFRGTPVARQMLDAAIDWARGQGCVAVVGSSIARLPHGSRLFANLLAKRGFTEVGPVLALEIQSHG